MRNGVEHVRDRSRLPSSSGITIDGVGPMWQPIDFLFVRCPSSVNMENGPVHGATSTEEVSAGRI